jgi:hypothetical protein
MEGICTDIVIKCGTLMKIREENLCIRRKQALNYKEYSRSMVDEFVERWLQFKLKYMQEKYF